MISYHPDPVNVATPSRYALGFRTADINDPERLAKGISRYVWSAGRYKNGHRRRDNFEFADWAVLDFDNGTMTLDDAINSFCDTVHIIGTTKSHRKDKRGIVCDRFRVMLRLDERAGLLDYEHTQALLTQKYDADSAAKDGARFFYPCVEIASIVTEGYLEPLKKAPTVNPERQKAREHFDKVQFQRYGVMPPWVKAFLEKGKEVRATGRNNTIYAVARALARLGVSESDALNMVNAAPFKRDDGFEREVEQAVRSGFKKEIG